MLVKVLPYLIAVWAVCLAAFAQVLLKQSAQQQYSSRLKEYLNWRVVIGYTMMGCSLLLNIYAMNIGLQLKELSIIETLSYLLVPMLSMLLFKEMISARQWLSIAIIMVGAMIFFL